MMEGSTFLHILHSVSKFYHFAAGEAINNNIYAFVGDRTDDQDPYLVQLQPDNAWTWKEVEVCTEAEAAKGWYDAHANGKACWWQGDLTNKSRRDLPRMLLLQTILAKFVLSKNMCTPLQLHKEVWRLVLDGVLDEDLVSFVKEWYIAVGQTSTATKSPQLS